MRNKVLFLIVFFYCSPHIASGQSTITIPITGTYEDIPVIELIQIIEKDYGVRIFYEPKRVPYFKVSVQFDQTPLYQALRKVVSGTVLTVQYSGDNILLVPKLGASRDKSLSIIRRWETGEYQRPVEYGPEFLEYQFGDSLSFPLDSLYRLQGSIKDRYSNDPIIGVTLQDLSTGLGTVTDDSGNFEYISKAGKLNLLISSLGYRPIELKIGLYEEASIDLTMSVASIDLDEVVIEAQSDHTKIEDSNAGLEFISSSNLKDLPTFLGEPDVIRSLELLPGVSTVGEASSGFNVRGGNTDQNLILLDEALVFNSSHALGFFSMMHPDAVGGVSLYKGNVPAKYGGRLSSVLAIDIKEPNKRKWHGSGGLGAASARLKLEGPLVKGKTGLLIGLRSTYSDWILRQAVNEDVRTSEMYFGDGLIKLSHDFSTKNQLTATAYFSHDQFQFSDDFGFSWNTNFINLRWRHLFHNKLALSSDIIKGSYESRQFEPGGVNSFNLNNGVDYVKIKSQLSIDLDNHFVVTGIESIRYDILPQSITPYDINSDIRPEMVSRNQGYETSIYGEDKWIISPVLTLLAGLRFSMFMATGPDKIYQYTDGVPKTALTVEDSVQYRSGEIIKTYTSLEPRLSLNIALNPSTAVKASYNMQRQFLHLISNTTATTPVDLWQLSNTHITPAYAHNFSIGGFKEFKEKWSTSVEAFYKISEDVIQYKDFADLVLNSKLETQLLQGSGRTYGLEFFLRKHSGKVSGQAAYTYSRSQVKTNSIYPEEQVNAGNWYPTNFDQPHQLNIDIEYQFNAIISCQFSFAYRSGRPITPPVSAYNLDGYLVTDYSGRNTFRIPDYHRFDFSLIVDNSESKAKGLRSSFSLNFYNLYSRQNAFTIFFRRDENDIPRAYQLAILGKLFPSLTWNFNF